MDYPMDRCLMIVTLITVFLVGLTHARQCYVCGISHTDPMYLPVMAAQHGATGGLNTLPLKHSIVGRNATETLNVDDDDDAAAAEQHPAPGCAQFEHPDANLDAFLFDCPEEYMGCFTQTDGSTTMRTCNRYSIDDCKTANRVTYCYCNTDRCNNNRAIAPPMLTSSAASSSTATKHMPPMRFDDSAYEDDDDEDGRGRGRGNADDDDALFEASGSEDVDDGLDGMDPDRSAIEASTESSTMATNSTTTRTTTTSSNASVVTESATTQQAPNHHSHRPRMGSKGARHRWTLTLVISCSAIIPVFLAVRHN